VEAGKPSLDLDIIPDSLLVVLAWLSCTVINDNDELMIVFVIKVNAFSND